MAKKSRRNESADKSRERPIWAYSRRQTPTLNSISAQAIMFHFFHNAAG
jgi:hypothetical protein